MSAHHKINYLEFPARDMYKTKIFFGNVFGWRFQDYGPDYCAFFESGLDGGFFKSDKIVSTETGSVLIVIFSKELEKTLSSVEKGGGKIIKPTFDFPGGRRFHFSDPSGNEFAVWSDQ